MGSGEPLTGVDVLRVSLDRGPQHLGFSYATDNGDRGQIRVTYPFELEPANLASAQAIGLGAAVYLGQFCLASRIELDFPVPSSAVAAIKPIAEMLYDVRCWKDGIELMAPPTIVHPEGETPSPATSRTVEKRSTLLWSGGKDSTLSLILLKRNGYQVRPVHVMVNSGTEEIERRAVDRLSKKLDVTYDLVRVDYPEFRQFSGRYAANWDDFPHHNTVPFGRDMFLSLVVAPVAEWHRSSYLSIGHERECRIAKVEYEGKVFPRNDVESIEGAQALEAYISEFVHPSLKLLPPVAQITEHRILTEMLTQFPDIMAETAGCFWGENCGRCAKCLRYYLAQRVAGEEVLQFRVNPLSIGGCPELDDIIGAWGKEHILFQTQVLYSLAILVEREDIRSEEDRLHEFSIGIYPSLRSAISRWEIELLAELGDPQVPRDFSSSGILQAPFRLNAKGETGDGE